MTLSRLFVYGTLLDDAQVQEIVGRPLAWRPALLEGYSRTLDPTIGYPVVHPLGGASVDGKLLEGVDVDVLAALDAYEGPAYRRVIVQVQTSDGRSVDAYVYVPMPSRSPVSL